MSAEYNCPPPCPKCHRCHRGPCQPDSRAHCAVSPGWAHFYFMTNDTPKTMNTTELLEAYTKANNSHWQTHRQMHGIKTQLDETVKERSAELRKTVAKIVRGTEWATEEAKYWLSIGHGTQPVTSAIHGHVKVWRGSKERGRCEMEFHFAPAAAAYVMAEIRRIVRHA